MSLSNVSLEDGTPSKSGWLSKMGAKNKAWKRRWFVLGGGQLLYYKKEEDVAAGREPKGEIPVEGCSVEFVGESKYARKFCFELHTPATKRVYVLASDGGADVQDWLSVINRAMLRIRRLKSRAAAQQRSVDALIMEQDEAAARRVTMSASSDSAPPSSGAARAGAAGAAGAGSSFRLPDGREAPAGATDDQRYDLYMEWLQETQQHQRRGTVWDRGGGSMHETLLDGEEQEQSGCGKCCAVM